MEQLSIADWCFPCQCVSLIMDFSEDGLLHRVLCCPLYDAPPLAFHLNSCRALCLLLPGYVVQSPPEISLVLSLDDSADIISKGFIVIVILCCSFPLLQVLPSESFPMFLVE